MPVRPLTIPTVLALGGLGVLALAGGCRVAEQASYEAHLSMVVTSIPTAAPDASDTVLLSALRDAPKPRR